MNIEEHGIEFHSGFLDDAAIQEVIHEIESLGIDYPRHGIRNAEKKLRSVKQLVDSNLLRNKARQYLSGDPEVVRVIVFDKTPEKNWLVAWHQDKTIAVSNRIDVPGWGPWTVKDGVNHVQPSIEVLENMITMRIHLDETNEMNGCLKVIPKSHSLGILSTDEQSRVIEESKELVCPAKSGDLLLMRPYILHASSKGSAPSHRRIVHVEYSGYKLPKGLAWT